MKSITIRADNAMSRHRQGQASFPTQLARMRNRPAGNILRRDDPTAAHMLDLLASRSARSRARLRDHWYSNKRSRARPNLVQREIFFAARFRANESRFDYRQLDNRPTQPFPTNRFARKIYSPQIRIM